MRAALRFVASVMMVSGALLITDAAVKFLEYLASPEAQNYFANGNNEWPTAKGVKVSELSTLASRAWIAFH